MNELERVVSEHMAYANAHPLDVTVVKALPEEAYRNFEHEGLIYRTCLSLLPNLRRYLLTVCKLSAVPDEEGARLPTDEEGEVIARAFFPHVFTDITDRVDILRRSRKYISGPPR